MTITKVHDIYNYVKALFNYCLRYRNIHNLKQVQVYDTDETIEYLLNNDVSMSRYGDGEFQLVWQYLTGEEYLDNDTFQKYDEELAKRLFEILSSSKYNNRNHLVCVPYLFFKNDNNKGIRSLTFVINFVTQNCQLLYKSLNPQREYYDSLITRFYLSEKNKEKSRERISKIKKLWEGKNICFIEGNKSRLGVGNDLFNNSLSKTRILCPSESAFTYYDKILSIAKEQPKNTLFILALGMTATVLAYDLSALGYRALDLGHIDIEYEWMLMGATEKVAIPNKYTNEATGGKIVHDSFDNDYQNEIICKIGC